MRPVLDASISCFDIIQLHTILNKRIKIKDRKTYD